MKKKKLLATTVCSRTYKQVLKRIRSEEEGICRICRYHHGCNCRDTQNSWKEHRNNQYR